MSGKHGEYGLQVALTSGHDALIVEQCQRQTTRDSHLVSQPETTYGKRCQPLLFHNHLQCLVHPHGLNKVFRLSFAAGQCLGSQLYTLLAHLVLADLLVKSGHMLHRYIDIFYPPPAFGQQIIHIACDEPRGRSAYNADARAIQSALCLKIIVEHKNTFHHLHQLTVQNLALHTPVPQPRGYLQSGGQRILHAVGQHDGRPGQLLKVLYDHTLHPSAGNENQAEVIGLQAIHILIIDKVKTKILFQFRENHFVRTVNDRLLVQV